MRSLPFVILTILLLVPAARSDDGDARTIVDRIVRTRPGDPGRADLAEMGCALLARPEKEVIEALAEAMRRRRVRDSVAAWHSAEIECLARLVVGSDKPVRRRLRFRAVAGLLVWERPQHGDYSGGGWKNPIRTLSDLVDGPPRTRLRLGINEKRILAFILEPEGRPTWSSDPGLAVDLGRALGRAVAEDTVFSNRLVEMLKKRRFAKKFGPEKWTTGALMAAVAFGPTKTADPVLLEMVGGGWNDYDCLALLRDAGRFAVLETVRDDLAKFGDRDAQDEFRFLVGGDLVVRPRLDAARKSGHPAAAERLADAGHSLSRIRGETRREILSFALELGDSEGEAHRTAARRVLNAFLWAGRHGTTSHNGYRARGVGGYPDPFEQCRRVRKDLDSGRIELLPPGVSGPGIYSGLRNLRYLGRPRGGGRNPVFLSPRREGDEVVVTITNGRQEPVCLSRTSFEYAAAEEFRSRVKQDGKKVDTSGVNLGIGAILTLVPSRTRREDYAVLAPGASLTFRYPLGKGFPAEHGVTVSFRDWFVAPENLPAPRVTHLRRVPVR